MKILKYIGLTLLVLVVAIVVLALVLPPPDNAGGVFQTLSYNGKTVHLARGGPGEIKFSASMEDDGSVIVNGQKIPLTGGDVFTVKIFENGRLELHKGTP